jgi:hypothetical protein
MFPNFRNTFKQACTSCAQERVDDVVAGAWTDGCHHLNSAPSKYRRNPLSRGSVSPMLSGPRIQRKAENLESAILQVVVSAALSEGPFTMKRCSDFR